MGEVTETKDWRKEAGFPRRACLDLNTPAELAIRSAVVAVEEAGAHPLLTDAVILLQQAREKVADHVDGITTEPVTAQIETAKWVVRTDDSGHTYLVPAEQAEQFREWVEYTEGDNDEYEGADFDKYRMNMHISNFVFEGTWIESK